MLNLVGGGSAINKGSPCLVFLLLLLSAHAEIFSVSGMLDFFVLLYYSCHIIVKILQE